MLSLNVPGYQRPLQPAQVDTPGERRSNRVPDGGEMDRPPSTCANISYLQSACATAGTIDGPQIFSSGIDEGADADHRQLKLSNVLAFWQIGLGESAFNQLWPKASIEVLAWYLMDFKDQCDFHWPEAQYPQLIGSRRERIRNLLDHAAIDDIFYQHVIDILVSRPQACIDDCDLKLAEISFLLLAGRVESVEAGARAAFRQGCMACAAKLALKADPGEENLESFALVNFYLKKLLDSHLGSVDAMVSAEPQCMGVNTISHARAKEIAEQALQHERENDYPYTRGAIVTSPGIKDALQRCLHRYDAGFRQSVSALHQQYECRTADLDLSQPMDIEKAQRFLCDRDEGIAESASARYLSALKMDLFGRTAVIHE